MAKTQKQTDIQTYTQSYKATDYSTASMVYMTREEYYKGLTVASL